MLVLAGTALLALGACATPRAVGQGDVSAVKGAAVAAYASQADGDDAAFAKAVQGQAISRLGGVTGGQPAYLVQVGVAVAPPAMGVSSAAGALDTTAWRSQAEKRRWWQFWGHRQRPARTVTLAVVDAKTGKTTAWSSIRVRKGEPADVADLLVYALQAPALKTPAKS